MRPQLIICLLSVFCTTSCTDSSINNQFDTTVKNPAFNNKHPLVIFDHGHNNYHTANGRYKPFYELIKNDGYSVEVTSRPFDEIKLSNYTILIIANARGKNEKGDDSAFTISEIDQIEKWILNGGSLLLITDHYPFGDAAEALATRFGVTMNKGYTEDAFHYDAQSNDKSQLVFSKQNGLLPNHPINLGRNKQEHIQRVVTFTGQSLKTSTIHSPFLALSQTAVDYDRKTKVEKSGNVIRVIVEYDGPKPSTGNAQGLALEIGKGRIVVLGEAALLTAQIDKNGKPFGMNLKTNDNRQLALNIMHWLSHII